MPHLLDLDQTIWEVLYKYAPPEIRPRVEIRCRAKIVESTNADGSHVYSTDFKTVTLDITDRVKKETPLIVRTEKPLAPTGTGKQTRGAQVNLTLINTDRAFAVAQSGAILELTSIQNAEFTIYATFGGQEIQIWRGKSIGAPEERRGETIFTLRDAVTDLVDVPIQAEVKGQEQDLGIDASGLFGRSYREESGVRYHHPLGYFNATGEVWPNFENSDTDKIGLRKIDFLGFPRGVVPSLWEIEFTSETEYVVRVPNGDDVQGDILQTLSTDTFQILPEYWDVQEDPTGVKIRFFTFYTVWGNPVRIIKTLIEHALLGNWGEAATEPDYLPVNWEALNYLESYFSGVFVYVSETNKDPSVYEFANPNKPISVKQVIEWIGEHIGCYLITDEQGRISLSSVSLKQGKFLREVNDDMLTAFSVLGNTKKYDRIQAVHGHDPLTGQFSFETIQQRFAVDSFDTGTTYAPGAIVERNGTVWQCIYPHSPGPWVQANFERFQVNEYRIGFRYFKGYVSDYLVETYLPAIAARIFRQHFRVSLKALPNHGLPWQAGDMLRINTSQQPVIQDDFEILSASRDIGGEVQAVLVAIPNPERTDAPNWCEGNHCSGDWCK